jgi:hypothetical protein
LFYSLGACDISRQGFPTLTGLHMAGTSLLRTDLLVGREVRSEDFADLSLSIVVADCHCRLVNKAKSDWFSELLLLGGILVMPFPKEYSHLRIRFK